MSLRDHLQAIYDEYGELSGRLVADVAKDKKHPLHHRVYDKPMREAADAYYVQNAENLIRKVKINFVKADGSIGKVRQWHPVRVDARGVFDPLDVIVENEVAMTVLLRNAERDWREMKGRYEHLAEFWEMVKRDVA